VPQKQHLDYLRYDDTAKSPETGFRSKCSIPACRQAGARREIFEERGVLSVRRSDEEIAATQQMGYFQRNQI